MRKILLFLAITSSLSFYAQLPQSLIVPTEKMVAFDDYEGSIYENLRLQDASVIDEKSGTFEAKLRYNIYTDAIEFKKDNDLFNIAKSSTTHARIDGDYYYYCEFKNQRGLKQEGYYILVELNENYRIYKKLTLHIREPGKKTSSLDQIEPGKIKHKTDYFIEERGVIMELPTDKKDILAMFSDKKKELETYIKSEKIKVRKEEDLVRLVSRYNALKSDNSFPTRSLLSNNASRN